MKNFILVMAGLLTILATACEPVVWFVPPLSPTQVNLPTPAIKTPRVNPICVDAHPNWAGEGNIDRQLALAKEAGVYWMRFDFPWDQIETSVNVWDFAKFDYIVDQARLDGIHIIATITQYDVPGWRNENQPKDYPASAQDYAMFVGKIAEHFKGRIPLYELGNEPDNPLFWQPAPDAAKFTQFLKKGYAVIKGIDPSARVISGGLTSQDQTAFVTAMYANGAKGSFDYFGYHPYSMPKSPDNSFAFNQMNTLRQIMAKNDDLKPIMVTEVGWATSAQTWGVSEETQAGYISRVFTKILFEDYQYVPIACVYDLRDDWISSGDVDANYGILRHDYTEKPAFLSLQSARSDFDRYFTNMDP